MIKEVAIPEVGLIRPASNRRSNQGSSQGFDRFMTDLENRNSPNTAPEPRERVDRSQETSRGQEPPLREEARPSSEDELPTQEVAETEVTTNESAPAEDEQEVELDIEIPPVIVEVLAEAVQVPPKVVYEVLAAAEVEPEELTEAPAANKFLQVLLKVESPVELLTLPEYKEALKQLCKAVEEVVEAPVPKEAKPALERLSGLVASVDEQNNLVISIEAEETEEETPELMQGRQDNTRGEARGQEVQASTEEAAPVVYDAPDVMLNDGQTTDAPAAVSPIAAAPQAAAVQTAAPVSAPVTADPVQVMQQIVSHVRSVAPENFAELRMTLRPEHLGDVTMRVSVQNGIVMALFVAESQRIKEIIESNFNQLRDALAEQGIEVSELFVSVNGDQSSEEQLNQFLKAQQEALRRLRNASLGNVIEEEAEPAPVDPALVMNNTVDFSA